MVNDLLEGFSVCTIMIQIHKCLYFVMNIIYTN